MINEDSAQKLAKKTAESIVEHGSVPMATLKETVIMQDKLDELLSKEIEFPEVIERPEVQKISIEGLSVITLKGDSGDKGETGERGENGLDGLNGKDGLAGKNGKDGENGQDGLDGLDGKDGVNGIDGASDTGEEIVAKINELGTESNLKIDASHIKNLPEAVRTYSQVIGLREVSHDATLSGTGTQDSPLRVIGGGGAGVTDGDKGDITVSASGATWTVDPNAVTNAKLAQMTTKTYKGRTLGTTGDPEDVPVATLKTDLTLTKSDVGLANVDNTSDANKPVSTAQQTALNLKVDKTTTVNGQALSGNVTLT